MRLLAWALGVLGRRRIRAGYCPACNSSPPDGCPLCNGLTAYGSALAPEIRDLWTRRWASTVGMLR